jgi:hypothetical protein
MRTLLWDSTLWLQDKASFVDFLLGMVAIASIAISVSLSVTGTYGADSMATALSLP